MVLAYTLTTILQTLGNYCIHRLLMKKTNKYFNYHLSTVTNALMLLNSNAVLNSLQNSALL